MAIITYDPNKIICVFTPSNAAVPAVTLSGWASGTFLTITQNGDNFSEDVGNSGDIYRIVNRNIMYDIAATLKYNSSAHKDLLAIVKQDRTSYDCWGTLEISDNARLDPTTGVGAVVLFKSTAAFIKKIPDQEFSDSLTNRTWTWVCGDFESFNTP